MQTLFPLIKPVGKAIFWRTKQDILVCHEGVGHQRVKVPSGIIVGSSR
nr:hypothetical protein [uncultured Desulfobacter sp.]